MTDLATRYGTPERSRRRLLVGLVAALAVVFVGWVLWAMLEHGNPEVSSDLVSFAIVDEHTASATFTVDRRSADVAASCLLRAQAADHSVVGELSVDVPAGGEERRTLRATVRTEREATTVDVVGCTSEGQTRRR